MTMFPLHPVVSPCFTCYSERKPSRSDLIVLVAHNDDPTGKSRYNYNDDPTGKFRYNYNDDPTGKSRYNF